MKGNSKSSQQKIKTKLQIDDVVCVVSGKYKGKRGKILNIDRVRNRVLVEKVNLVKKTMKKTQENKKGGILEKEAYIHISNVMYYHGADSKGRRLGYEVIDDKKRRFIKGKNKERVLIG